MNLPLFLANGCGENAVVALGQEACGRFKGLPKGLVFAEANLSIALTETLTEEGALTDFLNTLVTYATAARTQADISQKPVLFPYYPKLVNLEPNGGDPKIETEGFGSGVPNGINPYSETYTIVDGGECLYKQLLLLEGRELQVYKIDDQDVLYGTVKNIGGVAHLRGLKAHVSVYQRENTGSQTGAILILLTYTNSYKAERDAQIAVALGEELKALRQIAVRATGTQTFKVVSSCSGKSVTEGNATLSAAFAANMDAFIDTSTGLPYAGATLVYDEATDQFTTPVAVPAANVGVFVDLYARTEVETFKYLIGNPASKASPFYK